MDNKTKIMQRLKRQSGMTLAARERLKTELHKLQWWTRCWNCRKTVEATPADLTKTCPHCGVSLSERKGVEAPEQVDRRKMHLDPRTRRIIREDF